MKFDPSERLIFGFLLIGAFILIMGTLAWHPLPGPPDSTKNTELFGQGFVALIGALGIIVGAIWKTDKTERQAGDALNTLANKLPDQPPAAPQPPPPIQVEVTTATPPTPPPAP